MAFSGISHIGLTVTDLSKSQQWYTEVLTWQQQMEGATETTRFAMGVLPDGTTLVLREHNQQTGGSFDERRPGLDHLSIACTEHTDLDELIARLSAVGATWSPVAELSWGRIVNFRDPDNIAIEVVGPPVT